MTQPDHRTGPRYVLVTHSHLDREWYRTAEEFRTRLVNAVDLIIDWMSADPEFVYTLDGQTVVLEDYLAARPSRETEVREAVRAGRLAIGPWYVQPDGFIPTGESIVRNLLRGRRAAAPFGPASEVGYLPDTFGHPAQLPAILRGFGLSAFCFRRGMGDEARTLPSEFRWVGSDGTAILALYLAQGYSNAADLPDDPAVAATRLARTARALLASSTGDTVLFMNGHDHTVPRDLRAVVERLRIVTGAQVVRGTVDDAAAAYLDRLGELPAHHGELRGAQDDALLHGVLSTRIPLKLANAECEQALHGWAEPLAALARVLGGRDERPTLRLAVDELLHNHAHDSICGTSVDPVHEEMAVRFRRCADLAGGVTERAMRVLASADTFADGSRADGAEVAVFNPNPYPVSGVVRYWFDADPPYAVLRHDDGGAELTNPPLIRGALTAPALEVDGRPARTLRRDNHRLFLWHAEQQDIGVEFVAHDVPALGWRRFRLGIADRPHPETVDEGGTITSGDLTVSVAADGTLTVRAGGRCWAGLFGAVDSGDAGDTYDTAPLGPHVTTPDTISVTRHRHPAGTSSLVVRRRFGVPAGVSADRRDRRADLVALDLVTTATLHSGARHVEVTVEVTNRADDHRLRLRLPLATSATHSLTEGPFDLLRRPARPASPGTGWAQPPPVTFPGHGFVTVPGSGLAVVAPGLYEYEVTPDGDLFVTLLRSVGLIGTDLPGRGVVAPAIRVPGAQCHGTYRAQVDLVPYDDADTLPARARALRLGLRAVVTRGGGRWGSGDDLLTVTPDTVVLSAVKPAESGPWVVVRLWNPAATPTRTRVRFGVAVTAARSVRLDETPDGGPVELAGHDVTVDVPANGVRTLLIEVRKEGGVA